MDAVKMVHLTKSYQDIKAVNDLNLNIHTGELFALLGINGAGKTTTMKLLSCLTAPTGGDAFVGGYSVTREPERVRQLIAVSPQETAAAPNLTVRENLELMCGLHGFPREKRKARTDIIAAQLGLENVLSRKAGKLSGGWQRRVSIAMALIGRPQVLLLDEPTLGLDVLARSELWDVIRAQKGHMTIILTTHYMEEAQALSDRIGIMKDGSLLALGTARELMERTGTDRFEQAFITLAKGGAAN